MTKSMTVAQAQALINAALAAGELSQERAVQASNDIRAKVYYGCAMTARGRWSIITNRYGLGA